MFRSDERAAAMQIGAVLIFGFLVLAMTFNQAVIVPNENRQVEFESYQETVQGVESFRSDITRTAGTSAQSATTIETGTRYPSRAIAVNPPPAVWRVDTSPASNVTIGNARAATDDDDLNEYWNGDDREFETRTVRFTPQYNQMSVRPLVVSGSLAYREVDGDAQPLTSQTLLVDNRITVVTLAGEVGTNTLSTELVAEPVSVSTDRVSVTGNGGNLNLTIPSDASATTWESDLLAGNPYVVSVTDVAAGVRIELDGSQTYDLRLARVTVRQKNSGGEASSPDAHYIYREAGHDSSILAGQNATLVAETRDEFNNPVSGVDVTFTEPGGSTTVVTTDTEGHARFTYQSSTAGVKDITAEFDSGSLDRETTTFSVNVASSGGGGNVGTGGEMSWSPTNTTASLSQRGGLWTGISGAQHINISDPRFVSEYAEFDNPGSEDEEDFKNLDESESFRLVFVIEKDATDRTGTTRYLFLTDDTKGDDDDQSWEGWEQHLGDTDIESDGWEVEIWKDSSYNGDYDDDGAADWNRMVSMDIDNTHGQEWYKGTRTLDLLSDSTYWGSYSSYLDEVKTFMANNEVSISFEDVDGHTTMTVE